MKVLYYKSSRSRGRNFQIKTKVVIENSKKYVIKEAVFAEGIGHIQNIQTGGEKLAEIGYNIARSTQKDNFIKLEYIEGKTLGSEMLSSIIRKDKETLLEQFSYMLRQILPGIELIDFVITPEFREIFGDVQISGKSLPVSNIDIGPDNIVMAPDKAFIIDTEWTYLFPVPVEFIMYRNVKHFYTTNRELIEQLITFDELLKHLGIKSNDYIYNEMDKNFADFVHNDAKNIRTINMRYKLRDMDICLQDTVNNLNDKINELHNSNNELQKSKNELGGIKASRSWRYLGYIWKIRDKVIPKDSRRRLILTISLKAARHPIIFIKKLTPSKIKKSISVLKREGLHGLISRVDDCYVAADMQEIKINLLPKVTDINKADKLIFNKTDNPTVSIIIPVYNQVEYTYNCLKSISNNTKNISIEIIIANDCSTDETLKLANICENINIITNKTNLRFLKNCNNAALSAKGKYILFLNNDTQVMEDWLETLVDVMESDDNIGMVGSKLIYPDGRLQEAGGIIFSDGSGWNYGRLSNPSEPEYNYVKEVDYISGAAIMIRSTLWNEIGGFDEHFAPAYYEDTDLAFAVRSKGKKVVFVPKSIVVHFEGVSNGTDTSSGQKSYQVINAEKFKEKWKNELTKNHFANGENIFLARDRSKDKKTILVIDHYVPTHDKDAGSKCTFMYIRLMAKMGYNVKFIGDNFARLQPYADDLQNLGVEILCGNYYMKNWKSYIKDNAQYIDFVYLNRPHISEKYIDFIKENTAAKIIYFGHDLHHVRLMREYELSKDESIKKDAIAWKDREYSLFNKSDSIFVVGSYEQKIVANDFKDKNVYNIPVYFYDKLKDGINQNFETRNNIIFVGGFNHSPNVDAVIWFKQNIFPKILEKNPNIKWYIVGSNPTEQVLNLASDNIIVTGFISDEELEALYLECRLAVVPLRFGAGVKGKVIEAIYHKIPLITTNIGAEGLSTKEDAMIICDNADDFAAEVNNLYNNFDRLKQLSNNCDDFIKNNFTENVARDIIIREFI